MVDPPQGQVARDIAVGVGITTLVIAVSVTLPILGFFTSLVIPLPILFYRSKLGRRLGAAVAGGALLAGAFIFQGISADILFFGELLWLGFLLGELFDRQLSVERTVVTACAGVVVTALAAAFVYSRLTGLSLGGMVTDYVGRNLKLTLQIYQSMGVSPENIRDIADSLDKLQYVLVRILPSLALAGILLVSWINLLLARPVFSFRGLTYPDFGSLNLWKAPEKLVWGVIGCGVTILLAEGPLRLIGINGLIVLLTVYFLQGIGIVSFFFDKRRVPRVLRYVFYSLIAVQQFLLILVVGLGFFDMWLNFRKIQPEPPGGGSDPD